MELTFYEPARLSLLSLRLRVSHKTKLLPRKLVICGHKKEAALSVNSFSADRSDSNWPVRVWWHLFTHCLTYTLRQKECKMNYKLILKVVDIISGFTPRLKCHWYKRNEVPISAQHISAHINTSPFWHRSKVESKWISFLLTKSELVVLFYPLHGEMNYYATSGLNWVHK